MPIEDHDLIRFVRAEVEERTKSLYYRRPLPRLPAQRGARRHVRSAAFAVAAAAAVFAVLAVPAVLGTGTHDQGAGKSEIGPSATRWVIADRDALEAVLADPEALRGGIQPIEPATLGADPRARPPYPVEVTLVAAVPDHAVRYRPLDGYDGDNVRGWIGIRPAVGAVIWLQYEGHLVTQISARKVQTGEALARVLLHPEQSP